MAGLERFDRITWRVVCVTLLVAAVGCVAPPQTGQQVYQPIVPQGYNALPFDVALKGLVARSMPVYVAFPSEYSSYELDSVQGIIWAHRDYLPEIVKTKTVPEYAGVFHARLTPNIGYNRQTDSFICGPQCGEKEMVKQVQEKGVSDLKVSRHNVNDVPMMLMEGNIDKVPGGQAARRIYLAYLATLIDTNVILISYRPAATEENQGRTVWSVFVRILTGTN